MDSVIAAATHVARERYPGALAVFAAGSLVRGEGTAHSDLDLVVVFRQLPNAYRESFFFGQLPVEAFVHDLETLNFFFFEIDRPSGFPMLPEMVAEGVEIPEPTADSQSLKRLASSVIAMGPPALSDAARARWRYEITDTLDDLRAPRSRDELVAAGSQLYQALADFYFRTNGRWSAKGKSIPRKLASTNRELADRYHLAFRKLFESGNVAPVVALADELLQDAGGPLFDGYKLQAPPEWRKPA
jgi:hypothetical protein